jgi:hypothetical protein
MWAERTIPLTEFTSARGVMLPAGFPGNHDYWVGPAARRGGSGDRLRLAEVERLQLSLRRDDDTAPRAAGANGVEIESVAISFK